MKTVKKLLALCLSITMIMGVLPGNITMAAATDLVSSTELKLNAGYPVYEYIASDNQKSYYKMVLPKPGQIKLTAVNANNSFTKKIGNTTYIVSLKQSETAKKTLDEKIRELCVKEVIAEGFVDSGYSAAG